MAGLGIADYNALIAMVQATALPPQSRIRDLNSDSVCDTNDVIFLMNFLQGKVNYAYNYSDMDVTNDCVIDEADTRAYLAYYTYQSITNGTPAPTQNSAVTTNSTLTEILPDERPTVEDPRVIDWSKQSVVKLMSGDSNVYGYHGTGFIIDSHVVATAAHCVQNNLISAIRWFPIDSDGTSYTDFTPVEVHYPAVADGNNCIKDYALITVYEDLSDYADFSLGVPLAGTDLNNTPVSMTGFPAWLNYTMSVPGSSSVNINSGSFNQNHKYTAEGNIVPKQLLSPTADFGDLVNAGFPLVGSDYLSYSIYSSPGNSGSPVYYTHTYSGSITMSVLAIHSVNPGIFIFPESGAGPRINSDLLRFYFDNPNI